MGAFSSTPLRMSVVFGKGELMLCGCLVVVWWLVCWLAPKGGADGANRWDRKSREESLGGSGGSVGRRTDIYIYIYICIFIYNIFMYIYVYIGYGNSATPLEQGQA